MHRPSRLPRLRRPWTMAVALALVAVPGAMAVGGPDDGPGLDRNLPPGPDAVAHPPGVGQRAEEQAADALRRSQEAEARLSGPAAREERADSQTAHRDATGEEAADLLRAEFRDELERASVDASDLAGGGRVLGFVDDFAMRVERPGGGRELVLSPVPLRVKDEGGRKRPTDLSLRDAGAALEPANAESAVEVPETLEDGGRVGQVRVYPRSPSPGGAEGRPLDDASRLYAETTTDTDTAISVTPGGIETFTQLRSPAAPEAHRFSLDIPDGATLRMASEGGGAEVVQGPRRLMTVTPPWAVDAQGRDVPVGLAVDGTDLVLDVRHRGGDFAYPVLADPAFIDDTLTNGDGSPASWYAGRLNGLPDWGWVSNSPYWNNESLRPFTGQISCWEPLLRCYSPSHKGLYVYSYPGRYVPAGTIGEYVYDPPGTETKISNVIWGRLYHTRGHAALNPYFFAGIWNTTHNTWSALNVSAYNLANSAWGQDYNALPGGGQQAAIGMYNGGAGFTPPNNGASWRDAYTGGVTIVVRDDVAPVIDSASVQGASGWVTDGADLALSASATDYGTPAKTGTGLGLWAYTLSVPTNDGGNAPQASYQPCVSTPATACTPQDARCGLRPSSPCNPSWAVPATGSGSLRFRPEDAGPNTADPQPMREGVNAVQVVAYDGLATPSAAKNVEVKVDRSDPTLSLSGPLKAAEGTHLPDGSYQLSVHAEDGVAGGQDSARRSGVTSVEVFVNGESVHLEEQACPQDSCARDAQWTFNTADFGAGSQEVEVVATDAVDRTASEVFTVSSGQCCFEPDTTWGVNLLVDRVGFGDVDGDGRSDFVGRNRLTGDTLVRRSTGSSFATAETWAPGSSWTSTTELRLGDMDGDGRSDLVGRNSEDEAVLVGASTGDAFGTPSVWASWPSSRSFEVEAVDGAGYDDVVGTDTVDGHVYATYNIDGAPVAPSRLTTDPTAAGAQLLFGDVDGDGAKDLVSRVGSSVAYAPYVDGQFGPSTPVATIPPAQAPLLADVNADNRADLVDVEDAPLARGAVTVRQASRAGAFGGPEQSAAFSGGGQFGLADVDGDGRSDLVGYQFLTGDVRVALSNMTTPSEPDEQAWQPDPDSEYDDGEGQPIAAAAAASRTSPLRLGFQDDSRLLYRSHLLAINGYPSIAKANVIPESEAFTTMKGPAEDSINRIYDRLKEVGGTNTKAKPIIRFNAYWGNHEKQDGTYEFGRLEQAVDMARAKGFDVYLNLTGGINVRGGDGRQCRLATLLGNPGARDCDPASPPTALDLTSAEIAKFGGFARAAATKFKGKVIAYSVWNEPNNKTFLKRTDGRVAISEYRTLYTTAWKAIKVGAPATGQIAAVPPADPGARVFIGELSHQGVRDISPCTPPTDGCKNRPQMTPSQFLEAVLKRPAGTPRIVTNGVAWHPYQHRGTPGSAKRPKAGKNGKEQGIGRYAQVQKELDRLHKANDAIDGKPLLATPKPDDPASPGTSNPALYFTEFGYYNQRPRGSTIEDKPDRWQTESTKARWHYTALHHANNSRARWMVMYHATEAPPWALPPTNNPVYSAPSADPRNLIYSHHAEEYGLFSRLGEVTGDRPYGKGPPGTWDRVGYPQPRRTWCALYRWARRKSVYGTPASASYAAGRPDGGTIDGCPG